MIKHIHFGITWETVKEAKAAGKGVTMTGSRGSALQVTDVKKRIRTYDLTFDLFTYDVASKLTVVRREGMHEKGWKIPTELHVIEPRDWSATDIIKLFSYIPEKDRPDLKTFDLIAFRPTGAVFTDATGRVWFYYAKDKQLSPAIFLKKAPAKKP